ncbi:hypothetical protein MG293_007458 [Ovis ammon polii]|uniref:Antiluteolysin n=1 Tax=Ovis ammon polii TaxID=230172 RepID=A0AAD4YBS7_OVIAM|nr:hypothetical protein MG293_007458 [Ovis ammon polii]
MTYRCLLQMVLLLCLSTTALCRSYSLLRFQQGRSLEVCQNLLQQLPSTPQHCLEFRMDFQMPEEMKQAQQFRKEDAVLVMYEMLQHIFNILTRDFSSTGWSETIIEHLLEELYGQMNRLEPIQKEIMQKQNSTMGDTTVLHLKKYYFNLGQYLKAKEHNSQQSHRFRCASLSAQSPPIVPQRIILATAASKLYVYLDAASIEVLKNRSGDVMSNDGNSIVITQRDFDSQDENDFRAMSLLQCELCAVGASASHTRDSLHKARRQRKERLSTFSLSLHSIRALGRDPEGRGGNVSSDNVMSK